MIDLATEKFLTLEQAAERLLVNKSTVFRWITKGSSGVRLEAIRFGTRWRTSKEALQRFGDRLTPSHEHTTLPLRSVRTPAQRQSESELANERLDALLGVKKCKACRVKIEPHNVVIPKDEELWCRRCLVTRKSATVGQRIRTFRWTASLSQQKLSSRTGIDIDNLRAYELDRKAPTDVHIAALIEVLGAELVSGLEQPTEA